MRDALAERLLAKVMSWSPEDIARERPALQAMASYKYDEYRQFSPGMRYVESLALWLSQFRSAEERATAYEFSKRRLVFCSSAEMYHLVSIAYPDHIRPLLLRKVAIDMGLNERHVSRVASSVAFRVRQRQCLFLGLSDGARIDAFRRYNQGSLSHEQIWQTYEVSDEGAKSLLKELRGDVTALFEGDPPEDALKFRTVVLLDDFSGSGVSYLRGGENGEFKGKIAKFKHAVATDGSAVSKLVDIKGAEILVVLYMATEQARSWLETMSRQLWEPHGAEAHVVVVYPLGRDICIKRDDGSAICQLVDAYYDPSLYDEHLRQGGTLDAKYGFADCGLPLVLSHNTPNNSISLLWSYEGRKVRGLFPRVQRHKGTDEGAS